MKSGKAGKRVLWIGLAAVIIVAGALAGRRFLWPRAGAAQLDPSDNPVVTAFVGDLSARASASGRLLPQREARLSLAIGGRVEAVLVQVGDRVGEGEVLVQLESSALARAVRAAEQNLAIQEANLAELRREPAEEEVLAVEAAVASAQAQLADLVTGPSEAELTQAQTALESAQAGLRSAAARFAALDDQLIVAGAEVDSARERLERAQWAYDQVANYWQTADYAPHSPQAEALANAQIAYDVAVARYNLTAADINDTGYRSAQTQVAQAEASLAALTEVQESQIASARAQLAQAEANLAALLAGPSEERLVIAGAQVEQARISLDEALENLENATLVAPFGGVITAVYAAAGEFASGPVVDLEDAGSLEVVLDVDEVDIGALAVGQRAVITLEAWPDQELRGEVVSIGPRSKPGTEIVVYEVHLSLEAADLVLRTGMTANAELVTAVRQQVLLVPNRSITADREAARYTVNRLDEDGVVSEVEVTIGLRDERYTEIVSGLEEGDKLVIGEYEEVLDFMQGPPRAVRGFHG